MNQRRGASALGCLFSLCIIGALLYVGVNVGRIYWRFYEFQDDMRQEARYAGQRTNDQIVGHLKASADSLGLPPEASKISIRRTDKVVTLESEYSETVVVPMYSRDIHFNPHAEGTP